MRDARYFALMVIFGLNAVKFAAMLVAVGYFIKAGDYGITALSAAAGGVALWAMRWVWLCVIEALESEDVEYAFEAQSEVVLAEEK